MHKVPPARYGTQHYMQYALYILIHGDIESKGLTNILGLRAIPVYDIYIYVYIYNDLAIFAAIFSVA